MVILFNKIKAYLSSIWIVLSLLLIAASVNKYPADPYKPSNAHEQKLIEKLTASKAVNINTASVEELMHLKGIGQKRAEQIIAYRKKYGNFKNVNQIKRVPGVSKRFINDNKGLIITE